MEQMGCCHYKYYTKNGLTIHLHATSSLEAQDNANPKYMAHSSAGQDINDGEAGRVVGDLANIPRHKLSKRWGRGSLLDGWGEPEATSAQHSGRGGHHDHVGGRANERGISTYNNGFTADLGGSGPEARPG
jgi:hypothetical protein